MSKFTTPLAEEACKNFEVMVTAMHAVSQGLQLTTNATPSGDTLSGPGGAGAGRENEGRF